MAPPIRLTECLWVRSPNSEQPLFHPITRALQARNVRCFSLRLKSHPQSLPKLKELLWKGDDHIILHGLLPTELRALYPLLKDRRNFSVLLIDWWTSPFWFTRNAEYVIFNLYSGIALRTRRADFCTNDWRPPLLSWPEAFVPYEIVCAALRPAAVLAQPFLNLRAARLRVQDVVRSDRLIYFPIPVSSEDLPFVEEKPEYDFCSSGVTCAFWVIRDPYAPAKYNFANLYSERKRLADLVLAFEGAPYRIFDRRRYAGHRSLAQHIREALSLGSDVRPFGRLSWPEYLSAVRRSRLALVTGGLHQTSVPKYIEFACLGTPMIGSLLPYEYPWLDKCLFPIDCLNITPSELKGKLEEALEIQPRLRQHCLELREMLLQLYDPVRVLEMAQDQIDGKPIPAGYLREQVERQGTSPAPRG